jgi:hypothetical protein
MVQLQLQGDLLVITAAVKLSQPNQDPLISWCLTRKTKTNSIGINGTLLYLIEVATNSHNSNNNDNNSTCSNFTVACPSFLLLSGRLIHVYQPIPILMVHAALIF